MIYLVLLLTGAVLAVVGIALVFADLLTSPPKKPIVLTPDDVQLPFEEIRFPSHDGLTLVGWLVGPASTGPPIIILHGYTDNKSSYLSQARFLYQHGYPSFIYDQRGHGDSAAARLSLGPLEARDVLAAVGMLEERGRGGRYIVWGSSMGAATALLAAAQCEAIAAVISESSYERLDKAVADTLRIHHGIPWFPLVPVGLFFASHRTGVRLQNVSILDAVASLGERPLLVVSGASDPRMPPEVGERLFSRAKNGLYHLVVAGADHAECWRLGQPAYGERVLQLIDAASPAPRSHRSPATTKRLE